MGEQSRRAVALEMEVGNDPNQKCSRLSRFTLT